MKTDLAKISAVIMVSAIALLVSGVLIHADLVFKNMASEVSFRYPDGWIEKQPQLHSTIVLLYASDGSEATCNVNSGDFSKLAGLSEQQLDNYRRTNHTREYFEKLLKDQFSDLKMKKYWRGFLGQKDAGFAEYSYTIHVGESPIDVTAFIGTTFANGRRYVLTCNAPTGKEIPARKAFENIQNTMLFMH